MENKKIIYALGFFDGVHLGHQALLSACRKLAEQTGCKAGVVTFTSHPDTLVLGKTPKLINRAEDRARLLKHFGMDCVVELPFDKALMNMPWQDFLTLLQEKYQAAGFVCGHDFRFGFRGEGTAEMLAKACENCVVVPAKTLDGTLVSSSHIRNLLEAGQLEEACRFLGHPHVLSGEVAHGREIGRTMGIPTANLALPEEIVSLKHGVYACMAYTDGKSYPAVVNVGNRPTVAGKTVRAEAWLLDFDGDLYGKALTLAFHAFLRPEQKFPSLEDLQAEIRKNGAQVRNFFGKK
ncbi:MAG: bifunctional riboflavin kinase/FAD synthetase [Oscillospiraceae bacterium]|nr:bifunctional riboflavin kinase/FAD synthetase [Oscillospiraceae bacterium]